MVINRSLKILGTYSCIHTYEYARCHRYCEYRFAYDVMRLATLDNCFILINLCGYDIDRIPRTMPPRVLLEDS